MSRTVPALALLAALLPSTGSAGVIMGDNVGKNLVSRPPIRPGNPCWIIIMGDHVGKLNGGFAGRLPAARLQWRDSHGRVVHQTLPAPVDLLRAPVCAPPGAWSELTLTLDADAALTAPGLDLDLGGQTLTVVLDEPTGAAPLWLDLVLPDALPAGAPAQRAALEDAALLVRGED